MSAWTDLEATGNSYDSGSDPFFTREIVRALASGYLAGANAHDPLAAPLHADATLELLPDRRWFAGKATCSSVFAAAVGSPGDWRMSRTVANGQPAVCAYLNGQPFGVAVLDVRRDGIAGIVVFGDPALVDKFPH